MGRYKSCTLVASVQDYGQRADWPAHCVYVGMPGPAARAYGITDEAAGPFGKPWECLKAADGWAAAYHRYLIYRITNDYQFEDAVRALHGRTLLCWCAAKERRRGQPVA